MCRSSCRFVLDCVKGASACLCVKGASVCLCLFVCEGCKCVFVLVCVKGCKCVFVLVCSVKGASVCGCGCL